MIPRFDDPMHRAAAVGRVVALAYNTIEAPLVRSRSFATMTSMSLRPSEIDASRPWQLRNRTRPGQERVELCQSVLTQRPNDRQECGTPGQAVASANFHPALREPEERVPSNRTVGRMLSPFLPPMSAAVGVAGSPAVEPRYLSRTSFYLCAVLWGCPQPAVTAPDATDAFATEDKDATTEMSLDAPDERSGEDVPRDGALDAPGDGFSDTGRDAAFDRVADAVTSDAGDAATDARLPLDVPPRLDPIYATEPVFVAHIMAGGNVFLATARDGTLWGWGNNGGGLFQPAEFVYSSEHRGRPQRIDGVRDVREFLSTGGVGLCVLAGVLPEGRLYCWGRAAYSMYGNLARLPGDPFDAWDDWQYPQRMNAMVSDIVTLAQRSAVVRSDRSLWEFNGYRGGYWMRFAQYAGQVLDYEEGIFLLAEGVLSDYESAADTPPSRHRFAPGLQRLSGVVELSARNEHACMRINDGRVLCWGVNELGVAGNFALGGQCGTEGARWGHCVMTPTEIPGIRDAVKVVTGNYQTCAIRRDGTLWCWGANYRLADGRGMIGDGMPSNEDCGEDPTGHAYCRQHPVQVVGLRDVVDVAIATSATCALVASGQVYCWGFNPGGMLAVGTTTDVPLPLPVRW